MSPTAHATADLLWLVRTPLGGESWPACQAGPPSTVDSVDCGAPLRVSCSYKARHHRLKATRPTQSVDAKLKLEEAVYSVHARVL